MNRLSNALQAVVILLASVTGLDAARSEVVAIRGKTVYTMAGAPIKDGIVIARDGKIEKVGPAADIAVPEGCRVLTADVVTPGLIDAHTVVGLSGYLNQRQDQEQLDHSEPIQPELRAIDAYDPQERLVEWVRGFGITTLHTGHAPGEVISGQTMIVKTWGDTVDQATLVPTAMIAATLGDSALKDGGGAPGTRSKAVAMLRAQLIRAQAYVKKQDKASSQPSEAPATREAAQPASAPSTSQPAPTTQPIDSTASSQNGAATKPAESKPAEPPDRDLRLEALARLLRGELPLLVTVHRAADIMTALRIGQEFGIRIVLDGASEAYLVKDDVKAAGVPVILHPTMMRSGKGLTENASMETASVLRRAGIPFAMQSGFESYVPKTRVVLFEAGVAASNGLLFEDALAAITIDAAKILGIADRVGSLESGKDADIAMYDGDPFEYTSHCTGVLINGRVVSSEKR